MITVISGTSRADSNTIRVASLYQRLLQKEAQEEVRLLSLRDRNVWERGEDLKSIEKEFLTTAERFVFVLPEYNGSFPGILKTMLDNSDIRACWWGKKAMLTGLADGRAGNFRGLEHMSGILQYLRMHVYWDKLPISRINEELDAEGEFLRVATRAQVEAQISGFLHF